MLITTRAEVSSKVKRYYRCRVLWEKHPVARETISYSKVIIQNILKEIQCGELE